MGTDVSKKKNWKWILLYFILLFSFFKPRSLGVFFPTINLIYNYFPYVAFLFVVGLSLKKNKVSKIIYFIVLYLIILLFSTLINNGDISSCISTIVQVLTLSLIIDLGMKTHIDSLLEALEFLLYSLILLNFVSILMYPNGMYLDASGYRDNWLLGYKNIHILFILPAIAVSYVHSFYKKGKLTLRNYILLFISCFSLLLVDSSTSLVGILLISIFSLVKPLLKKCSFFNIKTYVFTSIFLFFSIVVFKIQNLFSSLIVNVFHRDVTLTGRVYIWDYVIGFIQEQPFLGYGIEDRLYRLSKTHFLQSYHAHNQFLEILYKTGIIGSISIILIAFTSFKELYKYKKHDVSKILSVTMFVFLVMMLTEAYSYEYFMYLFVLCYNSKYLIKNK